MKRRTSYRTHFAGKHRRGGAHASSGTAAKWLAAAVVIGLVVYVALAMGLGTWVHDNFLAGEVEPDDTSFVSPQPSQTQQHEITETVAFPAMQIHTLSIGTFDNATEANENALIYASRGGAGYVDDSDGYKVLIAGYDSQTACENVAEKLKNEDNITAAVYTIATDAIELKLTALPKRIDGIRDAFAIWQQTTQMLSGLWQDVDSGVCSQSQAIKRLSDQRDKLQETCDAAFDDALIQGQSTALDGFYDVIDATIADLNAMIVDPPENVLEVSSKIKYTGIKCLTQYQSYVNTLKDQLT